MERGEGWSEEICSTCDCWKVSAMEVERVRFQKRVKLSELLLLYCVPLKVPRSEKLRGLKWNEGWRGIGNGDWLLYRMVET